MVVEQEAVAPLVLLVVEVEVPCLKMVLLPPVLAAMAVQAKPVQLQEPHNIMLVVGVVGMVQPALLFPLADKAVVATVVQD